MLTARSNAAVVSAARGSRALVPRTCYTQRLPTRRVIGVTRVAAPPSRQQLADVDNAERARLESTDAFAELVSMNQNKQSVNRPQKVCGRDRRICCRGVVCPQIALALSCHDIYFGNILTHCR